MLRLALIGYGKAGQVFHAPVIRSVDGLRLARIAAHRSEASDVFDDAAIDVIVIATPNDTHFDLGRRALEAGKHVVIDKPFTVTADEGCALIALAKERNRILTVFHNRRWEGDFLTIRKLMDENRFGRIVSFEANFNRFRNEPKAGAWRETTRPGSGILYDLGSHLIDQALVLFGRPDSVTGDVRRERDFGGADDAFDIRMKYARLNVVLRASMLVRERTPRFTVRGTEATFVTYAMDPQEAALMAGRTPRDADWGTQPRENWGTLLTVRGEEMIETLPGSYQSFYENLRETVNGRAEIAVHPEEALATIEIIESCHRWR
jgi:predicted dehydrogenase